MPSQQHEQFVAMITKALAGSEGLEDARAAYDAALSVNAPPADAVIEAAAMARVDADWVSVPESLADRVILYLHGGGYIIGSNVGYREFGARLARATRTRVLLLNYRLAPEHPFPAAIDDAVAAFDYIRMQGVDPANIVIAGESAGGGLTLATQIVLRDRGEGMAACAIAISPWVDLENTGKTMEPGIVDDPLVTVEAWRVDIFGPALRGRSGWLRKTVRVGCGGMLTIGLGDEIPSPARHRFAWIEK